MGLPDCRGCKGEDPLFSPGGVQPEAIAFGSGYCPPSEFEEVWEAKTKPYPTHSVLTLTT